MSNPYTILGIKRKTPIAEIKATYKRLALHYHPDKSGTPATAAKFRAIQEAWEALDPERAKARAAAKPKVTKRTQRKPRRKSKKQREKEEAEMKRRREEEAKQAEERRWATMTEEERKKALRWEEWRKRVEEKREREREEEEERTREEIKGFQEWLANRGGRGKRKEREDESEEEEMMPVMKRRVEVPVWREGQDLSVDEDARGIFTEEEMSEMGA